MTNWRSEHPDDVRQRYRRIEEGKVKKGGITFNNFYQVKEFFKDKDVVILENGNLYPEIPEGEILARFYEIS